MIETIGAWLRKIVLSALFASVITSLIPEGSFRKLAGFVSGLIFLCVAIEPVYAIDWQEFTLDIESYRGEIAEKKAEFDAVNQQEMVNVIAAETATYILDKADTMGISCEVTVKTAENKEGLPLPAAVYLSCERNEELENWIWETLGIPAADQHWETNEEGAG